MRYSLKRSSHGYERRFLVLNITHVEDNITRIGESEGKEAVSSVPGVVENEIRSDIPVNTHTAIDAIEHRVVGATNDDAGPSTTKKLKTGAGRPQTIRENPTSH